MHMYVSCIYISLHVLEENKVIKREQLINLYISFQLFSWQVYLDDIPFKLIQIWRDSFWYLEWFYAVGPSYIFNINNKATTRW